MPYGGKCRERQIYDLVLYYPKIKILVISKISKVNIDQSSLWNNIKKKKYFKLIYPSELCSGKYFTTFDRYPDGWCLPRFRYPVEHRIGTETLVEIPTLNGKREYVTARPLTTVHNPLSLRNGICFAQGGRAITRSFWKGTFQAPHDDVAYTPAERWHRYFFFFFFIYSRCLMDVIIIVVAYIVMQSYAVYYNVVLFLYNNWTFNVKNV